MGGVLAQELAARLGERVTALGLVSTPAGGLAHPKTAEPAADIEAVISAHFPEFIRRFAATSSGRAWHRRSTAGPSARCRRRRRTSWRRASTRPPWPKYG